jgi:phage terminase large subunit
VIKSANGEGLIIFQGMQNHTAESIKSLEGYHRAWIEEAQSLSQRSLDLLRPTIRTEKEDGDIKEKSELWFSWNPRAATDPVDALLRGEYPPNDAIVLEINYQDNPFFPETLREEMEYDRSRDIDKYNHVWLGEYLKNSEARIFRNWTIKDFKAPKDTIFRYGADWGFAKDPIVLTRCFIEGRNLYIDYEAVQVECEIPDTPRLFYQVPDSEKWRIIADSARPEMISYMKKHGFPKMKASKKGKGSIEEGIEWLKSFNIIVHPRCKETIRELTNYSYKIDPHTEEILPIIEDDNNHIMDALRYACESIRRAVPQLNALEARK